MAEMLYPLQGKKVWVAGAGGMVGKALVRRLEREGCELLIADRALDLRRQVEVERWVAAHKPDAVFMAAAKVGGIHANNTKPAEFIYDNTAIETNIIHAAYLSGVKKLLFLGSSCIYPREASQPIAESALLTGPLEPTNQWYAIAKIAGLMMCQAYRRQYGCDFISAMPTNLYGPHDRFDTETSHVIPGMMAKFHRAKMKNLPQVELWGTGTPMREFLHVDELADALVVMMQSYSGEEPVNIGWGKDVSIRELAVMMAQVVGYGGAVRFNPAMPDGMMRKLLDTGRINALGWKPKITLEEGLLQTYRWYVDNAI